MTSRPDLPDSFEALPNPRGGSVRLAEMALTDALHAFQRQADAASALKRAIGALHAAGWLPAQRFAETRPECQYPRTPFLPSTVEPN